MDLVTRKIALSYLEGLDCARSLTVAILLRNEAFDSISQLRVEPHDYNCPEEYFASACATDLFRKCAGLPTGIDLKAQALVKWWEAEHSCYRTNQRISALFYSGHHTAEEQRLLGFFQVVRKNVEYLIGSRPPAAWEGRFGQGATVSDKSQLALITDKLSIAPTQTPDALPYLFWWRETKWSDCSDALGHEPTEVRGNTFFTVPKDSSTDRSCAKEPSLNVFYQLGLARVMRSRMKRRGINLDTGQDTHRVVAQRASRSGALATVDLSSASDTISTALVKLCLPHDWHYVLNSLRSPYTKVEGKWVLLEKFSSMGNGFTFELETCIFAALLMSLDPGLTLGKDLLVYGDDIIVPASLEREVKALFTFCGFTLNARKSFFQGPFRESCGGDFFSGMPVRAHFIKELPDEPQQFISIANGIRRVLRCEAINSTRRLGLMRSWFTALDSIPSSIRSCRGPEELGDLVIHDDESRWTVRWRSSIRYVKCYRPAQYRKVRWGGYSYDVQNAAALYGVRTYPGPGPVRADAVRRAPLEREMFLIPRDGVSGYKVGWVSAS